MNVGQSLKGEEYDPLFEEEAEPKVVSKRRYGPDYPTEEEYHAKSRKLFFSNAQLSI